MNILKSSRKLIIPVVSGLIIVLITSCFGTEKNEKSEQEEIQKFLINNPDLDFELKESGLYYLDVKVGTGVQPVTYDTIYVFYTARYLDMSTIGKNVGTADTLVGPLNVGFFIPGFDEAVSYMKVGGKSKFIVPSHLGYGNSGYYFPAYTPIFYEVDLVRVKAGPGAK